MMTNDIDLTALRFDVDKIGFRIDSVIPITLHRLCNLGVSTCPYIHKQSCNVRWG